MYYTITYDISNDKTRRLAVKLLKKAGLARVQRSVFTGRAPLALVHALETELRPLLDQRHDSLSIQPLDKGAFRKLRFSGKKVYKVQLLRNKVAIFG